MKRIFLFCVLFITSSAFAQTESSFGARGSVNFVKSFNKFYVGGHAEYRSNNNLKSTDNWFLTANCGYNFTKWLNAAIQYEYWGYESSVHKIVPILTATLKKDNFSFSFREKYEWAYCPKTKTSSNVLRSRFQLKYHIDKSRFTPYGSYEYFASLDGLGWLRSYHILGTDITINDHHSFEVYYLYHLYNGAKIHGCHILGIGYNMSF